MQQGDLQIVVTVQGGPMAGEEFRVDRRQTVIVGRERPARVIIPDDEKLSSAHFLLQNRGDGCIVRDLNSENGTFVNGEPVKERPLASGDQIDAGNSVFLVRMKTGDGETRVAGTALLTSVEKTRRSMQRLPSSAPSPELKPAPSPAKQKKRVADPAPAKKAPVRQGSSAPPKLFVPGVAESGVSWAGSRLVKPDAAGMVRLLSQRWPAYYLFDAVGLEEPVPGEVRVYDWLPEEVKEVASPILLGGGKEPTFYPLLEKHWTARDGICLFTELDLEALSGHVGAVMRKPQGAVFGMYSSAVLGPFLETQKKDEVGRVLDGLSLVMIRSQTPGTWTLYSLEDLGLILRQFGFQAARSPMGANPAEEEAQGAEEGS